MLNIVVLIFTFVYDFHNSIFELIFVNETALVLSMRDFPQLLMLTTGPDLITWT